MIDDGVRQLLTGDASANAVSDLIDTRMYPLVLPEPCTFPAVTYQLISNIEENTLDQGAVGATARIQFDIYAETLLEAKTIAKEIRALLKDFTGALPNGVDVANAWPEGLSNGYDEDVRQYYVQSDWMFVHDDV